MDPGPLGAVSSLEFSNFGVALQRHGALCEALNHSGATPRVDLEAVLFARGRRDRLLFQIDADPAGALRLFDFGGQTIDNFLVDDDGKNSVLEAIGEEDIAEARADDGADTPFLQRPHRALT